MTTAGPFPTFIIIGAQMSGAGWLCKALGKHPDVFTVTQETAFFSKNMERGEQWYRNWFDGWKWERAIGEVTPGYMMLRDRPGLVAARIDGMLPDVRLLALLRNPVDRARAAFLHHMERGNVAPDADLLDFAEQVDHDSDALGIINGGFYARSLAPYVERFGERLRVLLYDDLLADPVATYRMAARHIGVSPHDVPCALAKGAHELEVDSLESLDAVEGSAAWLTPQERRRVVEHFDRDIAQLEQMFGLDLQRWRETVSSAT